MLNVKYKPNVIIKTPQITKTYLYIFGFKDFPPRYIKSEIGTYHMKSPNSWPAKNSNNSTGWLNDIFKSTNIVNPALAHQNAQYGFEME